MTEPETSVERADKPTSDRPEDDSQQSVEEYVTETTIHEKEFVLSVDYESDNPLHHVWTQDKDPTLSSVAGALEEIQEWVEDINDEEWMLDQFRLETTIVAQRTEEEENSPNEEQSETEDSLMKE